MARLPRDWAPRLALALAALVGCACAARAAPGAELQLVDGDGKQVHVAERYTIEGRVAVDALPKSFSPSRVKLALDGGARTAVARADGGFQFSDVLPGVYLLEATAVGYSFPQLRVDVSAKHKSVRWARVAAGGARRWPAPVVVAAEAPLDYYEKEDGGGLMKMVMSPMGLMAVFMCVMAFVMPRMLEGIDPEELKKMQKEMQAQQKDNPLNKLMGQ